MSIYQPAEDSLFLSKFVKEKITNENPEKILDMGSGTGIQAQNYIEFGINPKNLTLVDISKESIKFLKTKFPNSKIIQSNLFENINGKFGLIIFNPPYLPEDSQEPKDSKLATTGGKKGSEIINKFLKQAKNHLRENGKILLLTSSLTKGINWRNYKKKLLGTKNLFFEKLCVWELTSQHLSN